MTSDAHTYNTATQLAMIHNCAGIPPTLASSSLPYMLMSGSDTEELPTAGGLNNKCEVSYLSEILERMLCDDNPLQVVDI